ncbi:alpha/beta hydrolase [Aspergillus niger CBS 101883]|uniref:alpha/beta hydrolase n=1 Tax=Aspergillus lacticoffeatus (strain CBS 101883) TaxID=1450533 RepID=UPI000D7F92E3|nr:alpha/beta-hydrolase [Aspergillus niger CBS 101883]PYH51037.1 alpha/beta-hydrolase [Aspergillus niger CBS 101883]
MENIFAKIAQDTTKFDLGDEEGWRKLYEPLYAEAPDNVGVVKDESYGPAERNRLDVYFPLEEKPGGYPVVLYVHGGGFFSGDKGWSEKRGFVTVLANHQLVPHVVYPGGADDMQLAREWIFENIAKEKYGRGIPEKVVLLGHSSGGAHIAMNLYAAGDEFLDNCHLHSLLTRDIGDPNRKTNIPLFPPVAGVIYLSVPFWFDRRKPVRQRVIRHYWGSDEEEVWGKPLMPQWPSSMPIVNGPMSSIVGSDASIATSYPSELQIPHRRKDCWISCSLVWQKSINEISMGRRPGIGKHHALPASEYSTRSDKDHSEN